MLRRPPLFRQAIRQWFRTQIMRVGSLVRNVRRLLAGSAESRARQNASGKCFRAKTPMRFSMKSLLPGNASPRAIPWGVKRNEDIMIQALSPEYERICASHLRKPGFGIADIHRMISSINAANVTCSRSSKGIAGRGVTVPAVDRNRSDMSCHYWDRIGHIQKICFICAKHEHQQNQRKKRKGQQQQQGGQDRQHRWQRRGKLKPRPPQPNGGRWRSYHNTTNHSDANDCAKRHVDGNAHIAAAHHTTIKGI